MLLARNPLFYMLDLGEKMRKLYSANTPCHAGCQYCFARWNDIYDGQPLFENVIFDNCRTDRYVSDRTAVIMNECRFYNMKKEEIFSNIPVEYVNCNI